MTRDEDQHLKIWGHRSLPEFLVDLKGESSGLKPGEFKYLVHD